MLKFYRLTIIFILCAIVSGCYNKSNIVGARGNQPLMGYSLSDMRFARKEVKVHASIPGSAINVTTLSTQRCHQYANETPPSEATLQDDLKIIAYAQGYDGISNLEFNKESALMGNCWFILTASATAFAYP